MTPEEIEDLDDMRASVLQIEKLVVTADADTSLSVEDAAKIAQIASQTMTLMEDLLAEAEEEGDSVERVDFLRDLLDKAAASDALAKQIVAR